MYAYKKMMLMMLMAYHQTLEAFAFAEKASSQDGQRWRDFVRAGGVTPLRAIETLVDRKMLLRNFLTEMESDGSGI